MSVFRFLRAGLPKVTRRLWLPWLAFLSLVLWLRYPLPGWLTLAAGAVILWVVAGGVRRRRARSGAAAALLSAVVWGFLTHGELRPLSTGWETLKEERVDRAAREVGRELDALLEAGERATSRLVALTEAGTHPTGDDLRRLRTRTGMASVILYDPGGAPIVWDGSHRGPLPPEVRRGEVRYGYGERPLFSYLYVTEQVEATGETAVAAALLRADLPPTLEAEAEDFVSGFEERWGHGIRIVGAERAAGEGVWDLQWDGRVLFSVILEEPSQTLLRTDALRKGAGGMALLLALIWILLAGGAGTGTLQAGLALAGLLALGLGVPLDLLLERRELVSPASFLLPGPLPVPLGRLLLMGILGILALGFIRLPGGSWGPGRSAVSVVVLFPLVLLLLRAGASLEMLAGAEGRWIAFQLTVALLLSLGAGLALGWSEVEREEGGARLWAAGGVLSALGLALGFGLWISSFGGIPVVLAAVWGGPAWLMARCLGSSGSEGAGWKGWVLAVLLGTTAALPFSWGERVEARMAVGEERLERLGSRVDPFLEFLLHRLGEAVAEQDLQGASPVEVLYRGWVESGLSREGPPIWLTLWSGGGIPLEELRVGVPAARPPEAVELLESAEDAGEPVVRRYDRIDAHYVGFFPLPGGGAVTAVIPPRRELRAASPLGPLHAGHGNGIRDPLTLVPLLPGDREAEGDRGVRWVRGEEGWQGETALHYPEGPHHAHYLVRVPGTSVVLARGALLALLNGILFLGLWGFGFLLRGDRGFFPAPGWNALTSFRARVTFALFAFFLLSLGLFGTVAYRTLSGAAVRTATALAERVVTDAAGGYLEVQGSLPLLARRVGADLLEYRDGELVGGSVSELVELGLYEGLLPLEVQRLLAGREGLAASTVTSLGRWEYAMAYRRLPDGGVLASPVPLEEGATVLRRREVADLLGFAVVLGGGLSLILALLVGRALTRPLRTLQEASEEVGSGNLRLRLPEDRGDEFGSVFLAFNRMVDRLRRARRDLVRTTRRTRAIVEEVATGVVALNAEGRVTLVNPRAEALLGEELDTGAPLPKGEGPVGELVEWVELYFRDGLQEAGTELQFGDRRIRLRARRILSRAPRGGVVLSLEDVTDELRSERILAWGEMAQQVAHEVKNPLTPLKLGVQHIRRAWQDRRPDFDEILQRNVDALLGEIDRLASIARSFSRFAAPSPAGEVPLERVDVAAVVQETMDLYATGEGPIRFRAEIPPALPGIRARAGELKEVLINLLENGRAAISGTGSVVVRAEHRGDEVAILVEDDGHGIPPELLPRIFEPHFSTRSTGAGLGLVIVHRLVESWGGRVTAESREGKGTTVQILLRSPDASGISTEGTGGSDFESPL